MKQPITFSMDSYVRPATTVPITMSFWLHHLRKVTAMAESRTMNGVIPECPEFAMAKETAYSVRLEFSFDWNTGVLL